MRKRKIFQYFNIVIIRSGKNIITNKMSINEREARRVILCHELSYSNEECHVYIFICIYVIIN